MLDAFESLLEQLQDPSPQKRLYALHELLKEEHITALPAQVVVTLFRTDPDGEVRLTALQGLASFGERVVVFHAFCAKSWRFRPLFPVYCAGYLLLFAPNWNCSDAYCAKPADFGGS